MGFHYMKAACKKDEERLFVRACTDRMRGNGFKSKESRIRLDIRKRFFASKGAETLE